MHRKQTDEKFCLIVLTHPSKNTFNLKINTMKNFITIIAMLFLSLTATAQKGATKEEARLELAGAMVQFVEVVRPNYFPGMTQAQFRSKMLGKSRPTPEGSALLDAAFQFLQKKTSSAEIKAKYSGVEVAAAMAKLYEIRQSKSQADGTELFGDAKSLPSTSYEKLNGCRWYQVGCWLQPILDFITDNSVIICALLAAVGVPCPLP